MNARLEELVRAIGLPAALRLVEKFGGVRVYLPHPSRVRVDSGLSDAIGAEAVRALAALWPSALITVPRAAAYLKRVRDRAIHNEKHRMTIRDLSLKYELHERTVFRILVDPPPAEPASAPADESQLQLF